MKRILTMAAVLILVCVQCIAIADNGEIRGWNETDKYCYIQLGTYPTTAEGERAPVLWRVLDVTDGQALVLADKILDVQQVIFCDNKKDSDARKFRKINDYSESDLCVWMNETMLPDLCLEQDFSDALAEGTFGKLYPLTDEQFLNPEYGFVNTRWAAEGQHWKCRQFFATDYAKTHELYKGYTNAANNKLYVDREWGTCSAWVATVKDPRDVKLSLLGYNGHLSYGVYTRVNVGVLPAMTLDVNRCTVTGGTGTGEDPFILDIQ